MALPLDVGHGPAEVAAYTGLMLGCGLLALGDVAVRARRDPRREQRLRASCSGCSSASRPCSSRSTRRSRPHGSQALDRRADALLRAASTRSRPAPRRAARRRTPPGTGGSSSSSTVIETPGATASIAAATSVSDDHRPAEMEDLRPLRRGPRRGDEDARRVGRVLQLRPAAEARSGSPRPRRPRPSRASARP